jgi:hypothetical protein
MRNKLEGVPDLTVPTVSAITRQYRRRFRKQLGGIEVTLPIVNDLTGHSSFKDHIILSLLVHMASSAVFIRVCTKSTKLQDCKKKLI